MKKFFNLICAACLVLPGNVLSAGLTGYAVSSGEAVYEGMKYETANGAVTVTGYTDDLPAALVIPAEIGGLPVTKIGDHAFEHCEILTGVTIPESVTEMGEMVFADCTQLAAVSLPGNLHAVSRFCFGNCDALERIVIPEGVTELEESAFDSCDTLADITIPECVTEIGMNAFKDTAWLTEKRKENRLVIENGILIDGKTDSGTAVIPEGVTKIVELAFSESKISGVQFPESLTEIGSRAFRKCESLRSVTIPAAVKKCGSNVFMHCTALTSVTLEDGVTEIADGEFRECKLLKSITIPESVTRLGDYAFADSSSLAEIVIPESVTEIGGNAFRKTAWLSARQEENPLVNVNNILTDGTACEGDVVIPDNVTAIAAGSFKNAQMLTGVTVPEGITEIGALTFFACPLLERVKLPDSITSIGYSAFSACEKLSDISIPGKLETLGHTAFSSCAGAAEITIPASLRSIGQNTFNCWKNLRIITILNPDCEIYDAADTICNSVPFMLSEPGTEEGDTPAAEPESGVVFTGTIRGYDGSTAQVYAEKYGRNFESLGKAPELRTGDFDGDGTISIEDAQNVLRVYTDNLAGKSTALTAEQKTACDVNNDNAVDVADAQLILNYYVRDTLAKTPTTWEEILNPVQ